MPSFTWCGACREIMIGLPLVIDYLWFFFLFSLLTTKVHNCPLCLLFVKSNIFVILKYIGSRPMRLVLATMPTCMLGFGNHTRPTRLESGNHAKPKLLGFGNHSSPKNHFFIHTNVLQ